MMIPVHDLHLPARALRQQAPLLGILTGWSARKGALCGVLLINNIINLNKLLM